MKNYHLKNWISFHWTKKTRYYRIILHQDLFGDWIITRVWGRIGTKMGMAKAHAISYQDGLKLIAELCKVRQYRGYKNSNGN
jgi:predicted DNA-binding WGR domain protein